MAFLEIFRHRSTPCSTNQASLCAIVAGVRYVRQNPGEAVSVFELQSENRHAGFVVMTDDQTFRPAEGIGMSLYLWIAPLECWPCDECPPPYHRSRPGDKT